MGQTLSDSLQAGRSGERWALWPKDLFATDSPDTDSIARLVVGKIIYWEPNEEVDMDPIAKRYG
jgi:hypothetical protein